MSKKTVAWTRVIFEVDSVRTPGEIRVSLENATGSTPICAEVAFEGVKLQAAIASGTDNVATLMEALRLGTTVLAAFRAAGGKVLQENPGWGAQPFEQPLESYFLLALKAFGLEDERIEAEIVKGPTPDASGEVAFTVRALDRTVEIFASPCGVGMRDGEDLDAANLGTRAVFEYMAEHRDEELALYREAARLRRAAGNAPPFGSNPLPHIRVLGRPRARDTFVEFVIEGAPVALQVAVFTSGAILDDCEDWLALSDAERSAGIGAALDYVFANREELTTLGLDVDLLAEFYR